MELREFVYLDSLSVNSLLASQQLAIPETVRNVSEDIRENLDNSGWGFGLGYEGIANVSYDSESGQVEESHQLAETQRRVNDQFLFSILHRSLENEDMLVDIDEYDSDDDLTLNSGDVVKVTGSCQTDPLYRTFNTMSTLMRIENLEEVESEAGVGYNMGQSSPPDQLFETLTDILHGDSLSLKLDSENYHRPFVMPLDVGNLWTNRPEREFIDTHDYTVVGRVSQVIPNTASWDFVEILRIMDSVFSDESVDTIRNLCVEVISEMREASTEGEGFDLDVEAEREDFVIEESAVVLDPIAVYW